MSRIVRASLESGFINFSAPAFHRWAVHYYKCRHDFVSPHQFSPLPYFLLCRSIELELKARHLENKRQHEVRQVFRHRLYAAYRALARRKQTLSTEQSVVLRQAGGLYAAKRFEYIRVEDALSKFKHFPDLEVLDSIARELLRGLVTGRAG